MVSRESRTKKHSRRGGKGGRWTRDEDEDDEAESEGEKRERKWRVRGLEVWLVCQVWLG